MTVAKKVRYVTAAQLVL